MRENRKKTASGYFSVIGRNFKSDYTSGLRFSVYFEQTNSMNKVYFNSVQSLLSGEGLYTMSIDHHGSITKLRIESKYTLFI